MRSEVVGTSSRVSNFSMREKQFVLTRQRPEGSADTIIFSSLIRLKNAAVRVFEVWEISWEWA